MSETATAEARAPKDEPDLRPVGETGTALRKLSPALPAEAPAVLRVLRTLRRLVEGLYIHDGLSAGPAMAFHFFLSLLPLLVVVGWVLGHVARARGVEVLFAPVFETAPDAVAQIGKRELERLAAADLSAAPLAVVGFMWLASSGVHGMMDAFERALSVPIRRPYWKKRLYSLAFVFVGLTATAIVAFASVGLDSISQVAKEGLGEPPDEPEPQEADAGVDASADASVGESAASAGAVVVRQRVRARVDRALALVCFLVLSVSGVAAFYRFAVETPKNVTRRVWPGAMLAIALWLLISWGFGFYVTRLGQYTLYYGSLAAVAVLLMWFWLTSLALLVGAELNAQLEGQRH